MGNMLNRWNKAKENFESKTGVKKPKGNKKILGISIKSSGIEKSLGELEELTALTITAPILKKIESAFSKFQKNASEYIKVLSEAIDATDENNEKAIYNEQCRILKIELDYYINFLDTQVLLKRGVVKKWGTFVTMAKQLENSLILSHRIIITAMAEVKTDPTIATWNRVMSNTNPPIRSLTTALKGFDSILTHVDRIQEGLKNDQTGMEDLNRKIQMAKSIADDYDDAVEGNNLPYGVKDYATYSETVFRYSNNDIPNNQTEKDFVLNELRKLAVRVKNIHERFIKPFDKYEDTLGII